MKNRILCQILVCLLCIVIPVQLAGTDKCYSPEPTRCCKVTCQPGGKRCHCDRWCSLFNDCCPDYEEVCQGVTPTTQTTTAKIVMQESTVMTTATTAEAKTTTASPAAETITKLTTPPVSTEIGTETTHAYSIPLTSTSKATLSETSTEDETETPPEKTTFSEPITWTETPETAEPSTGAVEETTYSEITPAKSATATMSSNALSTGSETETQPLLTTYVESTVETSLPQSEATSTENTSEPETAGTDKCYSPEPTRCCKVLCPPCGMRCYCDKLYSLFNDCCSDYEEVCQGVTPTRQTTTTKIVMQESTVMTTATTAEAKTTTASPEAETITKLTTPPVSTEIGTETTHAYIIPLTSTSKATLSETTEDETETPPEKTTFSEPITQTETPETVEPSTGAAEETAYSEITPAESATATISSNALSTGSETETQPLLTTYVESTVETSLPQSEATSTENTSEPETSGQNVTTTAPATTPVATHDTANIPVTTITIDNPSCFSGNSTVQLEDGTVKFIKDVRIKDRVLAVDTYGELMFSEVIMLMDVLPDYVGEFVVIKAAGRSLHLTPAHLLYVSDTEYPLSFDPTPVFAGQVKEGQFVYVAHPDNGTVELVRIEKVFTALRHGAYAPLTEEGTIVVDNILASCYAVFSDPKVAHWSLAPFRWLNDVNNVLQKFSSFSLDLGQAPESGMAWYPKVLFQAAKQLQVV